MIYYVALVAFLVLLDQGIKLAVRMYLTADSFIEILPNLIHLTYQENKGISFSLLSNLPDAIRAPMLSLVSLVVILAMGFYLHKNWPKIQSMERWGFALVMSGAIGNLIDRAFRQQVTDYMYFHYYNQGFFVNNLADDLISIGFVLMLLSSFTKKVDKP